jgi:hypothetical protein
MSMLLISGAFFLYSQDELALSPAANEDIVSEGTGMGSNETEALMAAKRDAVEKGIGLVLLSQTEIENFMVKRDMVITKTIGSVKNFEVLSKTKASDGNFEIKIRAHISRTMMREDLAAFHILLESMEKPKVMVVIRENNIGNDEPNNSSAENAIIGFLKSPYDFEIIDPAIAASIRMSNDKMNTLASGDAAGAAAIGSMHGAEVLITGTAISREATGVTYDLAGMKSVQADVTLRAINCTTGRIIATGQAHAAKVHLSPNTAGSMAITTAAVKASKTLLDALIQDWNKLINNGIPLTLIVNEVSTFREKNAVIQTLKSLPNAASVYERSWNSESKVLMADVQYKGNANGFCTKVDGYKMSLGGGSFAVTGQSGIRITLVVQAK